MNEENRMKFSVIISVYKNDDPVYFDEAFSSIIKQTVSPSEIVLVIDGKIPNSIESVIKNYTSKYNNLIKVVRLAKNQGHAKARQAGIDATKHEIVSLMDSDDISVNSRFEKQLAVFEQDNSIDVIGGQIHEFVDSISNVVGIRRVPLHDKEIKDYLKYRCPMNQVTIMMKKSALTKVGGYIDWHFEEDYYLWVRMFEANCKFKNIDTNLVFVRVGDEMYKRRGGLKYFLSEEKLQRYMLKRKIINVITYSYNVTIRFIVQVLMPNKIRSIVFQKLTRES